MKNIDLGDEIKSVFDPGGEMQQMLAISKRFSDQLDDMNQVGPLFEKTSYREICFSGFSKISHFLEFVLVEHIDMKNSLNSKLPIYFIYSFRTSSRKKYLRKSAPAYFQPISNI